jgi:small subunit ribosomal protein S2
MKALAMYNAEFSMRQLLEAGVHFGHSTRRWNPKMSDYIFGVRNGTHILDLEQSAPLLRQALAVIRDIVARGGRVLVVGTKRQASEKVAEAASRCGQYYVNHRWLGGMMTNWQTISNSIKKLREFDEKLAGELVGLTKKEMLQLTRERDKLERALGGIKEMGGLPDILFVIDTNKESLAIAEANKLGIPVVGILDSNSDPRGINYPIPGNDDALRAISLYCELLVDAVLDGIQQEMIEAGVDLGESEEVSEEDLDEVAAEESGGAVDAAVAEESGDAVVATEEVAAEVETAPVAEAVAEDVSPSETPADEQAAVEPSTEDENAART